MFIFFILLILFSVIFYFFIIIIYEIHIITVSFSNLFASIILIVNIYFCYVII